MIKIRSKKDGYTLVEMIIYATILSFVAVVVVYTLFSFVSLYRNVSALRVAENSGIYSIERMSRDIIYATTVDTGNSTLGTSPGVLTIIASDGGISTTTKYYVDNGVLKVDVNGSYVGPLTGSGVEVIGLTFYHSDSGKSDAVRVDLSLRGTSRGIIKDKNYHTTILLRGSY
ncbi:MAG: type II secretion system protein [Minisyncoccia bacterium]